MYADRDIGRRFNPGSLGVALGVNGALIGALFFAAPTLVPFVPKTYDPLITYTVPPEPVPAEPARNPAPRAQPRVHAPVPPMPVPTVDRGVTVDPLPAQDPMASGEGVAGSAGTGIGPIDPPKPIPPQIVAPGIDPRFAGDFQPSYPPEERRAEREGRVVVRVLVGTDGRVKTVERVAATTDAFYRATLQRALARWRFTPGTRDGVAVESWKTMTLTFVLER